MSAPIAPPFTPIARPSDSPLKGLRVRMTPLAIACGVQGRGDYRTGYIVGRRRADGLIRVLLDGQRYARTFSCEFFGPEDERTVSPVAEL